jgi:hypothetical protein
MFDQYRAPEREVGIETRESEVEPDIYDHLQGEAIRDLTSDRKARYSDDDNVIRARYSPRERVWQYSLSTNPWIYQS